MKGQVYTFDQRSDLWFQHRLGKVTGSHISDVMAKGQGITRAKYMNRVLLEKLTGEVQPTYQSASMAWGTSHEDEARMAYEFYLDRDVTQVGFIDHPTIIDLGVSPDGLIGDDGGFEVKCKDSHNHEEVLLGKPIERGHLLQCQINMACWDATWWDYCNYDPRYPEKLKLHVQRVARDDKMIEEIEAAVVLFNEELLAKIEMLDKL